MLKNGAGTLSQTKYKKNHSRWITDLNVRGKITKTLEENIGVYYCDSGLGNGLSDMKTKAQEIKLGFIKTKNLCVSKDIKTVKRKPTGENIYKYIYNLELTCKIYKELL